MIQINENFEKAYKDSMAKGFSITELLAIGGAVSVLALLCFVGYFLLGWNLYISFLIGMLPAGLIIFSGFWRSPSDLNIKEYYIAHKKRKETELLIWKCREFEEEQALYEELMLEIKDEMEGKKK